MMATATNSCSILAAEMLASANQSDNTTIRATLDGDDGYITPKVDVRGAVFQGSKVLLVQEAG